MGSLALGTGGTSAVVVVEGGLGTGGRTPRRSLDLEYCPV